MNFEPHSLPTEPYSGSLIRFLLAMLTGIVITFGLFKFMATLIHQDRQEPPELLQYPVEFISTRRSQVVKTRSRILPKKPPPPEAAPSKPKIDVAQNTSQQMNSLDIAQPLAIKGLRGGVGPYLGGGGSGARVTSRYREVMPIVRIEPNMPHKARTKGIQGYVVVSFTVTKSGSTSDIEIIEAKPPKIFDYEVKRAILKWKYKPQMIDGKVAAIKQRTRFVFEFDDEIAE